VASHFQNLLLRRGSSTEFNSINPILASGEPAIALDTNTLKIGNGHDCWEDLDSFVSTYDLKKAIVNVNIPSIAINQSNTLVIDFDGVNTSNKYAVIVSPQTPLSDGIVIAYAYVSDTNKISVVLRNTSLDYLDGGNSNNGGQAQSSSAQSNIKLNIVTYLVYATTTTTTTTTQGPPSPGTLRVFGNNSFGQLGTNNTENYNEPHLLTNEYTDAYGTIFSNAFFNDCAVGDYHSLLSTINKLYSIGYNYYGQLGIGTNGSSTNVKIPTLVPSGYNQNDEAIVAIDPIYIAAGSNHSLVIDDDNKLFAFGSNAYGCLGLGDTSLRSRPTLVGDNIEYSGLSKIVPNTLLIIDDKYTFGDDTQKYLLPSTGTYIISGVPQQHAIAVLNSGLSQYITYSGQYLAGSSVLTGTTADSTYKFYYGNIYVNVLGDFGSISVHSQSGGYMGGENLFYYKDPNTGWQDISAGKNHSIGIKNGSLYAFGQNTFGQLGTGDNYNRLIPTKIGSKTDWVQVAAGNYHSLAIDSNGALWAFGKNDFGQLGLGHYTNKNIPTQVSGIWETIEDFDFNSLLSSGALGIDTGDVEYIFNYTTETNHKCRDKYVLSNGTYVISGIPSSCAIALLNDGKQNLISYSGTNFFGSKTLTNTTNDGTYNFYYGTLTIDVSGDFEKLSVHSYSSGYMGGENILYYYREIDTWASISAGNDFSIGIANQTELYDRNFNGPPSTMWSFGKNNCGQLGLGDTENRNIPVKISINDDWMSVDAGASHCIAINNARRAWSFGNNSNGQLGLGDNVDRYEPTIISSDVRWENLSLGGNSSELITNFMLPTAVIDLVVKNASTSNIAGSKQLELCWKYPTTYDTCGIYEFIILGSGDGVEPFVATQPANWDLYNYPNSPSGSYSVCNLNNGTDYVFKVIPINPIIAGMFDIPDNNYNSLLYALTDWSEPAQPCEAIDPDYNYVKFLCHFDAPTTTTTTPAP
jgi:alpha-tubulin suppressor-like RCC1 family protein